MIMSKSQTLRKSPIPEDEFTAELMHLEAEEAIEEQEQMKREREAAEQELRRAERERRKKEMRKEMRRKEEEKRKAREEAERKAEEEQKRREQEEQERKEQEEAERKEWEETEKKEKEEQEQREKEEAEKKRTEEEKKKQGEEVTKKRKDKGKEKKMEKAASPGALLPLKKKQKVFVGTGMAGPSWPAQEREIVEIEDNLEEEPGPKRKMGGKHPCWKCWNTGYSCEPHPMKTRNACIRCTQTHGQCGEKRPPPPKREGVSGSAGNGMTWEQGAELLLIMQALVRLNTRVAEGMEQLLEVTERLDRQQEAALRVLARLEDGAEEVKEQEDATVEKPDAAGTGETGEQGDEEGSEGSSSREEDSGEEEGPAGDGMDLGE